MYLFNTNFNLNLPVDVTYNSVDKIIKRSSIPSSISYLWLNNTTIHDGLPENNIKMENAKLISQNSKKGGIETGMLSIIALILVLFL